MEMELSFVRLLRKIFGEPAERLIRPFVEEEGRNVTLAEVLMECIDALPLTKPQRNPDHLQQRMKLTLLGHYGLEGAAKPFSEISSDLGVSSQMVANYEARACCHLRHPRYARRLSRFFVPTPEEIVDLKMDIRVAEEALAEARQDKRYLLEQVEKLRENQERLEQALQRVGGPKPDLHRILPFEKVAADREAFQRAVETLEERAGQGMTHFSYALFKRTVSSLLHPRQNVQGVEDLRTLIESGAIWRIHNLGEKGVGVAQEILRVATELLS